jgi:hypothetical protein
MVIEFPDGTIRREHDYWRLKVEDARLQYEAEPNKETRTVYKAALKRFAELVVHGKAAGASSA